VQLVPTASQVRREVPAAAAAGAPRRRCGYRVHVPTVVNIDGVLVAPEAASVSVFDRGFLYGDSVYEVVRTYGGRPFELPAHLARLAHSAERIGLEPKWGAARTAAEIDRTLDAARNGDAPDAEGAPWNVGERYVRVVMTRGAGAIGLDPALAVDPVALVIVQPLQGPPARAYLEGVKVAVVGVRRASPKAIDPSAKTGARLPNVLAVKEARAAGAHEALLLDDGGFVTEGSSSSVFAVRGGRLLTPPLKAGILEGVTRGIVLGIAAGIGVPAEETPLRPGDLDGADEIFITSTIREIVPVTRLGDRSIGSGRPGPVTHRLHREFRRRAGGAVSLAEPR
jgi:branched-chain amino acid aminotransferase